MITRAVEPCPLESNNSDLSRCAEIIFWNSEPESYLSVREEL